MRQNKATRRPFVLLLVVMVVFGMMLPITAVAATEPYDSSVGDSLTPIGPIAGVPTQKVLSSFAIIAKDFSNTTTNVQLDQNNDDVVTIKNYFASYFKNKLFIIITDQNGAIGVDGTLTIPIDPEQIGSSPYFYSYNRQTNQYRRIECKSVVTAASGGISITFPFHNEIIISDGPLVELKSCATRLFYQ